MANRITVTVLTALMCLPLLSACANGSEQGKNNTGTTTTAADSISGVQSETSAYDALPDADFDGYDFKIVLREGECVTDMFQETETEDNVQSAVYNRNSRVSERYDIELVCIEKDEMFFNNVTTIFAGDDEFDLILPHGRFAGLYCGEGMLIDWNTISSIDLDAEWWDQNCRRTLSVCGHLYCMTGDISYWSYGATRLMLFNKNLFNDLNLDYPYEAVKSGSWTTDMFETIVRKGSDDLNGDGNYDTYNDRYGYMSMTFLGDISCYHATGNLVVSKDEDDYPFITYYTERASDIWSWYWSLIKSDCCYFQQEYWEESVGSKAFQDNRVLFIDLSAAGVADMRATEVQFGVIPWPKYEESDPYLSSIDAGVHLFCIPVTASDPERTGTVLNALGALGSELVIPEYYEQTLKYRDTRDDESIEMLDLIFNGRVYDLGYFNVQFTGSVGKDENIANNFKFLSSKRLPSLSTVWAKFESPTKTYFNNYMEMLEANNDWND